MNRIFPVAFGALQIGLVGVATYILCSANLLNEASVYLTR